MKYCKYCGNRLEDNQKCTCDESQTQSLKVKKNIKKYGIVGGVICIVAIIIIIVISIISDATKIDAFDYINVTYSGYDSNGTAIIEFDKDSVVSDIIGEEPDIEDQDKFAKWIVKHESYYDAIDYSCENQNNLSNGDNIIITITASDIISDKVIGGNKTYTVSGLSVVEKVDVFESINVEFEGVSGDAKANITYTTDADYITEYTYDISQQYGLSNGDIITVTVNNVDEVAEKYNVIPKEHIKQYVVPTLESYVTSAEQISISDIQHIIDEFIKEETDENKDDSMFSYGNVTYYGTYLLIPHEDAITSEENTLEVYVKYDQYQRGEFWRTVYTPLRFKNITISYDGKFSLNYDSGSNTSFVTDIDSWLENLENEYYIHVID